MNVWGQSKELVLVDEAQMTLQMKSSTYTLACVQISCIII